MRGCTNPADRETINLASVAGMLMAGLQTRGWTDVGAALVCVLLIGAVVFGGCTLPRDGGLPRQCTADSECEDTSRCTLNTCTSDGYCESEAIDVELPQQLGDCKELVCIAGQETTQSADGDLPDDDNECTRDRCTAGEPSNENVVNATPCMGPAGAGSCQQGACEVICPPADCDDSNQCTIDTCQEGVCHHAALDGVAGLEQEQGDCRLVLCQDGSEADTIDNTDLPDDLNDCTDDLCNQGTPTNPAVAIGTPCPGVGDQEVCDGAGSCVECIDTSHCEQIIVGHPDCGSVECVGNICGRNDQPAGTLLNPSNQTDGDCQQQICDGMGDVDPTPQVDDTDLPDDLNDCTEDLCNAGAPVFNSLTQGDPCGTNQTLVCTGPPNDLCVGCNDAADCGVDTDCLTWSCDGANSCQQSFASAGTPTTNQVAQDCLQEQCDGAGNPVSVAFHDPIIDGNVCTQDNCNNGMPENPDEPLDTPCMTTMFCDGAGSCVQCNSDGQCNSDDGVCEQDKCLAKNCMIVNDSAGTPAPVQEDGDCKTVVCDGNGDPNSTPQVEDGDLPIDSNECTEDVCTAGSPSNPAEPAETSCSQNGGVVCNGDMGAPACVECATVNQCGAGESCDTSTWTCKQQDSQPCSDDNQCLSNHCIDGVCCNTTCTGTCQACDVAGSVGACTLIPFNQDPDDECVDGACDGAGTCKLSDGIGCGVGTDCLSGECTDGVCCDDPCGGNCEACDLAGSVGACTLVPFGEDPDDECANGACNAGACQLDDGQVCGAGSECLSGNCIDGVCCDTACGSECEACNLSGTEGTCTLVPANTDPDSECGSDTCDGAGACAVCGDGTQQATEACDDGFADACGSCNANCTGAGTGSTCGDSSVCPETETCDDGFADACGSCNATCDGAGTGSTCGDGITCPETEACDDNNVDACGTCDAACATVQAGNDCPTGIGCVGDDDCTANCDGLICL